jgi:hypothetical protein
VLDFILTKPLRSIVVVIMIIIIIIVVVVAQRPTSDITRICADTISPRRAQRRFVCSAITTPVALADRVVLCCDVAKTHRKMQRKTRSRDC